MKKHYICFLAILFVSNAFAQQSKPQQIVNGFLDQWHKDVAVADFDSYFNKLASSSVFVGTDASEVWTKKQFQEFSKPFFDKKETWNFKAVQRNIYFSEDEKTAWFDEVLDTWMGLCRGSGVLIKQNDIWKIEHYVLSVTVPNDDMKNVINIKRKKDSLYLKKLKGK